METKIINTTPAGLRELLDFAREPYSSSSEEQVSFEDIFRRRELSRLLGRLAEGSGRREARR